MLNSIHKKLLSIKSKPPGADSGLTSDDIEFLCETVRPILLSQPSLLHILAPVTVCGDLHGQYYDLIRIFEIAGYPPDSNFLFLGDYVDRGMQSIETICLLLVYKIKYPENFFLLRGNHECSEINKVYGFYDQCLASHNFETWEKFNLVFDCLPIAAIIQSKIFCVHGGLSPEIESLDQIEAIERPCKVPEEGLICDLLWADPNCDVEMWEESDRGTSYSFGINPVKKFLDSFEFNLICRAHQTVMSGYSFPFYPNQSLLTLFSAPHYCAQFGNRGAILRVDENLVCSFNVFEPMEWVDDGQTPKSNS